MTSVSNSTDSTFSHCSGNPCKFREKNLFIGQTDVNEKTPFAYGRKHIKGILKYK